MVTVEEAEEKKTELFKKIVSLMEEYEEETGLSLPDVTITRHSVRNSLGKDVYFNYVMEEEVRI